MSVTADLEKLHDDYNKLQKKSSEATGGINLALSQLKEYNIQSIEDAEKYIKEQTGKKKKKEKKLDSLIQQIETLIKN